ncbi:LPXTG cell wall anchor domain-containing protein [Pseudalkalibacillus sp. Hm43]|uniref:LPXTG cell wall anchor domain-containing protein n=1 Tax=Pseudalkalibacillus sp. Hm43 TaxID=3450742 RepID=UPI003F420C9C
MRLIKRLLVRVIILYSAIMLVNVFYHPVKDTGAEKSAPLLDISTSPASYLFDLQNLKPGDWAERKLVVSNDGNIDFDYRTLAKFKDGSKKLYDQLDLKIEDQTGVVLFEDKLYKFDQLTERKLDHHHTDEFVVTVTFPSESGNEFQGLGTTFELEFSAQATKEEVPTQEPKDPDKTENESPKSALPQTGESNPIWYYLTGIMLAGVGVGVLRQSLKGDRPRIRLKR